MNGSDKARVLCVDDEIQVLDGLARQLFSFCDVVKAPNGPRALELLKQDGPFAVIISDMRMPDMDGATLLSKARSTFPEVVRILLTGQADMYDAMAAVNQGQIFCFLCKPCPPGALRKAMEAALAQHELLITPRELQEGTLHGCVKTLTEILALVQPEAFGKAIRLREYVCELCTAVRVKDQWQVEIAAMLSQIGCVTLPSEVAEKHFRGQELTWEETTMVEQIPGLTQTLLAHIPRLDQASNMIEYLAAGSLTRQQVDSPGARVLKIVVDYDQLRTRGVEPLEAIAVMRNQPHLYDLRLLKAFRTSREAAMTKGTLEALKVVVAELKPGMVVRESIKTVDGRLLVNRGHEIGVGLIERLRNYKSMGNLREPICVDDPEATVLHR